MAEEKPLTDEEMLEIEDYQEDLAEDEQEKQLINTKEFQDGYGSPESEEKQNQHSFLANAVKMEDTVRVTNLNEFELGRPMFSVRFLLDMEDISKFYLDKMGDDLKIPNKVSNYFRQKILNITDSGMSKDGFVMNLNVTRKMDTVRKKVRENVIENLQGGKKKRR